jgi:hypothetical protein
MGEIGSSSVGVIFQLLAAGALGFARRRFFAVLRPAPFLRLGNAVACVCAEYSLFT